MTEAELNAIRERCEAAISALSGAESCVECPDYGEPNGCNREDGACDAYFACNDAAELLAELLAEIDRLKAERDAAVTEVCRRCPDGEVIDGIKHYPCNGCKWRGVQEKEDVK
jgi:hypothetical protein